MGSRMNEEWRAVPGHEGYEVSNLGRVRSYRAHGGNRGGRQVKTPRIKTTRRHNTGYSSVVLQAELGRSQAYSVHVLVAAAFLGPRPEGYQVAHFDGDKMNARLDNLRYATPVENAQDKHRHGTTCHGEAGGNTKLTTAQVQEIVARYGAGELQRELAARFGISQSQVSNIVRRASWSHLNLEGVA
jgi:hypothetical protein